MNCFLLSSRQSHQFIKSIDMLRWLQRAWLICRLFSAALFLFLVFRVAVRARRRFPLQLQTAWRRFLAASCCGESHPDRPTLLRSDWRLYTISFHWSSKSGCVLSRHVLIRIYKMCLFFICRCTVSRPLQCNWTSCVRRWREPFLRLTAG